MKWKISTGFRDGVAIVRNHPRNLMNQLEVEENVDNQKWNSFFQVDINKNS